MEVAAAAAPLCVGRQIAFTGASAGITRRAAARYAALIFPGSAAESGPRESGPCLSALALRCTGSPASCGDNATLGEGMDEAYDLTIPGAAAATLQAASVWGLLRGLETFAQMVEQNGSAVGRPLLVRAAPVRVRD